jgi:hypothetical protein
MGQHSAAHTQTSWTVTFGCARYPLLPEANAIRSKARRPGAGGADQASVRWPCRKRPIASATRGSSRLGAMIPAYDLPKVIVTALAHRRSENRLFAATLGRGSTTPTPAASRACGYWRSRSGWRGSGGPGSRSCDGCGISGWTEAAMPTNRPPSPELHGVHSPRAREFARGRPSPTGAALRKGGDTPRSWRPGPYSVSPPRRPGCRPWSERVLPHAFPHRHYFTR